MDDALFDAVFSGRKMLFIQKTKIIALCILYFH